MVIDVAQYQAVLMAVDDDPHILIDADGPKIRVLGLRQPVEFQTGLAGFIWRSNAAVFEAFCSAPVNLARLSVKVLAIRKSMRGSG